MVVPNKHSRHTLFAVKYQSIFLCLLARPVVFWSMGPHQQPIKVLIAWQGLFVIVLAAWVWGGAWSHNKILFHCDNLAVGGGMGKGIHARQGVNAAGLIIIRSGNGE